MAEVLYPVGYGSTMVTMRRLKELHWPGIHPLFGEPLFAWLESENGEYGIGGGWRDTQPSLPGFAPDKMSFHQWQEFVSKLIKWSAVDLVRRNPNGGNHLTMRWSDTDSARAYGLHTFINGEPWHMQSMNIRGWQSWVNAGRPDPVLVNYPGKPTKPIPPPYQPGDPVVTTTTTTFDPPPRIMDSRWWDEAGRFGDDMPNDNGVRHIPCPRAAGAKVAIVTLTAVEPKGGGFGTLFKQGDVPPNASHINYGPALPAIANTTRVPVAADGSFKVYMMTNTHVVIDLVAIEK